VKFVEYRRPVLISGIIAGVISSVPFIGWLNICCGLWLILGGVLGIHMVCSDTDRKINYGEGALIGLFIGLIAAVISTIIDSVFSVFEVNFWQNLADRVPQIEEWMDFILATETGVGAIIYDLLTNLLLFSAFGALGGIIGTAIYSRKKETEATA